MKQRRPLLIGLAVVAIVGAIWTALFLQNPPRQTLDQRVHSVGEQLKCPVCQSELVADFLRHWRSRCAALYASNCKKASRIKK